jgi:hypothetical protein
MFLPNVAQYPTDPAGIAGIWAALLLMLAIYSYPLYKENPIFRFAEHTFIAASLAITIITNIDSLLRTQLRGLITGEQMLLIVAVILGFMMYALLHPDYRWISRYPIAILVGSTMGLGMASTIPPNIISQVVSTITAPTTAAPKAWFDFVIIAIGTICATLYFLLTYEHTGALKPTTQIGRWFIMLGLGAYFGNTVLFRLSMLSGRAQYLLQVLKIIPM